MFLKVPVILNFRYGEKNVFDHILTYVYIDLAAVDGEGNVGFSNMSCFIYIKTKKLQECNCMILKSNSA